MLELDTATSTIRTGVWMTDLHTPYRRAIFSGPAVWVLHLLIPVAALWLLVARPEMDVRWQHHPAHFWLVLFTAAVSVALGVVVGDAARRRDDDRLFLIGLAFVVAAGFLGLHALATPGIILASSNTGFDVATPVGLLLASILAAVSSIEFSPAATRRLRRLRPAMWTAVAAVLTGWAALSLLEAPILARPLNAEIGQRLLVAAAFLGTALYGVSALRYYLIYRRRPAVMLISLITAFTLLAEAMFAIGYGRNWHASWWEWHVLMALAFAFVAYSAYVQYRREGSPAGLFHGVALASTVNRMRRDYADALDELARAMRQRAEFGDDGTLSNQISSIAGRFDLTEQQLDVLERAADALGRERTQTKRLGALVTVGQQASVNTDERQLLEKAMAVASETFAPLRLRLGLMTDGRLEFADGGVSLDPTEGATVVIPLDVKGHRAGQLEVTHPRRAVDDTELALLRSFASQLSIALENTRLYASMEDLFRSYLSPDVATSLIADPSQARLGGEIADVTVLMADLHGFTPFAERGEPDDVVAMLNTYYRVVVPVILEHGGTVVQFVGDAVMAIFNAPARQPDHPRRAARAALALQEAVERVRGAHPEWPRFRAGIHTGRALVGNIGSDEFRNYTAIGDTTNLAARLESAADPGQVVVSAATRGAIGDIATVEPVGPLPVKGKSEPVEAFVLRSLGS
ncbi:hypothetical protein GCM10025762_47140 [Haloechinothrix salitolerans]